MRLRQQLLEPAAELLEGISILKETTGVSRVFFAVSRGHVLTDEFMQRLLEIGADPVFCPNEYPIALEPLLVPFLTGQELPPNSGGSRAFGTVVIDVATALRVRDAARRMGVQITAILFQA